MEILKKFIQSNKKTLIAFVTVILLCIGLFVFFSQHKPEKVQGTSQTVAETPKGVEIAGEKAGYKLDGGQSQQVAQAIREIRTEQIEPVYIVTTTGSEVKAVSEQARKDNHADFSLVTNKNNPDETVDLNKIDKDAKVELNQYNIQCYKKYLRQVEVGRSTDGYTEVGFTISKKITNDGQYIGLGIADEWKDSDNRVLVKVVYTW